MLLYAADDQARADAGPGDPDPPLPGPFTRSADPRDDCLRREHARPASRPLARGFNRNDSRRL